MAAVRRRSGGGIVVALVFFVVLAIVGIGGTVWFYQQFRLAKNAIAATEEAVNTTVAESFRTANWELPTQDPSQFGVTFTSESYRAAAAKLEEAREYLHVVKPLLGYADVATLQNALRSAEIQPELVTPPEGGEPRLAYDSVQAVLERYGQEHIRLTQARTSLAAKNASLKKDLDEANKALVERQNEHQLKINELVAAHRQAITKLEEGRTASNAARDAERAAKLAAEQKVQAKEAERLAQMQELRAEIRKLEKRIKELTAPPAGETEERLVPVGEVIAVKSGFITIGGGENKDIGVNSEYVVYSETPDGKRTRKALVRVGRVYENVSEVYVLATASEEALAEGDLYCSEVDWNRFAGR